MSKNFRTLGSLGLFLALTGLAYFFFSRFLENPLILAGYTGLALWCVALHYILEWLRVRKARQLRDLRRQLLYLVKDD